MVEIRAGRRRTVMTARYRLPAILTGLSAHVRVIATRAGLISEFWNVEARINAAVPLMSSSASCGFPSPADDYIDEVIDFNERLILHPAATFCVRATGDSMIGVGIFDGDVVVVDRSIEPQDGLVIVAVLNLEFTIKTYRCRGDRCWLQAENPKYSNIELSEASDFEFWGAATNCIRSLTKPRR